MKACCLKGEPAKSKSAWKRAGTGGRAKWVQADNESDCAEDEVEDSMVYKIKDSEARPITVHLHINGIHLKMEVDTGAAVSIISEQTQKNALLQRTSIKLRTYTDEALPVLGEMAVEVTYLENTRPNLVCGTGKWAKLSGEELVTTHSAGLEISGNSNCTEGSIPIGGITEEIWGSFPRGVGHNAPFPGFSTSQQGCYTTVLPTKTSSICPEGGRGAGAGSDGENWSFGTCKPQPVGSPYCSGAQEGWSDTHLWRF